MEIKAELVLRVTAAQQHPASARTRNRTRLRKFPLRNHSVCEGAQGALQPTRRSGNFIRVKIYEPSTEPFVSAAAKSRKRLD